VYSLHNAQFIYCFSQKPKRFEHLYFSLYVIGQRFISHEIFRLDYNPMDLNITPPPLQQRGIFFAKN
jgi:hypothetical protein